MSSLLQIAVMTLGSLLAQDVTPPAVSPAPTEPPAPSQLQAGDKLSQDSSVDQVLDALDHRGQGLKDFTASVVLTERDPDLGDSTKRKGSAVYQKKGEGDARIRVVFGTKQEGKKIFNQKVEYLLENGWLTDRDYERKTEVRRQVLRPGEKVDLLKLGEGPFPLPVGQPKEKVEKLFEVTKLPPKKDDPAEAVHIQLKPKPDTQFARKFSSIDVWVDTKTEMPKQIETLDVNQRTQRRTNLEIQGVNTGVTNADFTLPPTDPNWNRHDEPYSE